MKGYDYKTMHIHMINAYDFQERRQAFWEGRKVEFTKEEWKAFKNVDNVRVTFEWDNKVLVVFEPEESDWENSFK